MKSLREIINSYDPAAPLDKASTIPATWYTDESVYRLELQTAFTTSWQMFCRLDQVSEPGRYVTGDVGAEPVVVVRGSDGELRGFFNVCRHHAAAVMTEPEGRAAQLRCPYHGWTYSLEGELKGTPDFSGVCDFERGNNNLLPLDIRVWEKWVFVRVEDDQGNEFPEPELSSQIASLNLKNLHWLERRHYRFDCNWKVFVDNYLDGGYHVPYLHKGLDSVLDYSHYAIENGEQFCLQSSPIVSESAEPETGAVRQGERALYYWIYPNFMINWYQGAMDTNLVIPRGVAQTEVIFDYYFPDISEEASERNRRSIAVGERIQDEDVGICKSVQRGLNSRAYEVGRLSVRREAGEHLFHRLLHRDLSQAV